MTFEEDMKTISEDVNIKKRDRSVYLKEFNQLRDYLMEILKKDRVFKRIFGGCVLFGSYLDRIKVGKPDEFDVHFGIKLPYHELIEIHKDKPGFVRLNLAKALKQMQSQPNDAEVYNLFKSFVDDRQYLERKPLRTWLDKLFEAGLNVEGTFGEYTLSYSKGGTAFTIFAKSKSRLMKIDLVPAFQFDRWMAEKPCPFNEKPDWFAVAQPKNHSSFSICVPNAEESLLSGHNNLKASIRMIKSLKIRDDMPRLKSYYIKTVYLWELEKSKPLGTKPLGEIFIHMLGKLCEYFEMGGIPFYWDNRVNLLQLLTPNEIQTYKQILRNEHKILSAYQGQKTVSYQTLRNHFAA